MLRAALAIAMAAVRHALFVEIFAWWFAVLDDGVDRFVWNPMVLSRKVDGMKVQIPAMV